MTSVTELLAGLTFNKGDGTLSTSELFTGSASRVVGLYFSAHWCPPCRGFTPVLAQKYAELRDAGKDFEIVFVSSDSDEASFADYFGSMPWAALPYAERDLKEQLSTLYGVRGIPTLVLLDGASGEVITKDARGPISGGGAVAAFPFHPAPVNDIGSSLAGINDGPVLMLMGAGAEPEPLAAAAAALKEHAVAALAAPADKRPVGAFFTVTDGGPVAQISKLMGLPPRPHGHELARRDDAESFRWGCDGADCAGDTSERYRCGDGCDYDLCGPCHAAAAEAQGKAAGAPPPAPFLRLMDIPNKAWYAPPGGDAGGVDGAAIAAFVDAFAAGGLTSADLAF